MTTIKPLGTSNGVRSITMLDPSYQPGDEVFARTEGRWEPVTIVSGPVVRAFLDARDLRQRPAAFVEPYAGGAGAGITLLRQDMVRQLVINDIDPAVTCFWLSVITHRPDVARDLSPFLSWAHQRRLCGPLIIPRRPRSEPLPGLPDDQRWQHLNGCLTGATPLPLAARAAAAITLLYGAPLTQVLTLRGADILTISGRSHLQLGQHPVLLPPAVARLLGQQATAAAAQPAAPEGTRWLFHGRASVRPVTALAMTRQLNQHGIHLRAGRTAALVDLAGQLPPAVLASLLGLHPATADRWSRRIASDWTAYLHARTYARRETSGGQVNAESDSAT